MAIFIISLPLSEGAVHTLPMIFAFGRGFYGIFFHHGVKILVEIVGNTK